MVIACILRRTSRNNRSSKLLTFLFFFLVSNVTENERGQLQKERYIDHKDLNYPIRNCAFSLKKAVYSAVVGREKVGAYPNNQRDSLYNYNYPQLFAIIGVETMKAMSESTKHYKARNNQNYCQSYKAVNFKLVDTYLSRCRFSIFKISYTCNCCVVSIAGN